MSDAPKPQAATLAEAQYRNALMWAFDRLSVDGGMTVREHHYTMRQIGNVLRGLPSPAATYKPKEWDDSAALRAAAGDGGGR